MKNSLLKLLTVIICTLTLLQSCQRHDLSNPLHDDKLLLAKVSGHLESSYTAGFNFYTYDPATSNFSTTYTYGPANSSRLHTPQLNQIQYILGGTWDYLYNNLIPDRTIDHSAPGQDLGYWKYYVNHKGQIEKTGLAFKVAEQPRDFEFYSYDEKNNLTSFIYGRYADTPSLKITYDYDNWGNLTAWSYYFPIGYVDAAGNRMAFHSKETMFSSSAKGTINNRQREIQTRLALTADNSRRTGIQEAMRGARLAPDSSVLYGLFFKTKITWDQMNNPFNQQGRFLFYQTNRGYTLNLIDFYLPLMKHNPLKVEYSYDLGNGTFASSSQEFTYTYNNEHYPVTIHEVNTDPDAVLWSNYLQDFAIEYLRNW